MTGMPARAQRPCQHPGCPALTNSRYCQQHDVKTDAWGHTKSAAERGYDYKWYKLAQRIMRRDHYLCQVCLKHERPTPADAVDHIIPKSQNGTDDESNLQAICNPCHKLKTQQESHQ